MSHQSQSSQLQMTFEAALQNYAKRTGVALAEHPLTEELRNCDSVDSVISVLQQVGAFSRFRESSKITKPIENIVSALYKISAVTNLDQVVGLPVHPPPIIVIFAALGILLSAAKDPIITYDALVDILELMEALLKRLDVSTTFPPTVAMTEIIVQILMELLSALALATEYIKPGRLRNFTKMILGMREKIEATFQRLDRLTLVEMRVTTAQSLEVLYGLLQDMRVLMDGHHPHDNKVSMDNIRESLVDMPQDTMESSKSRRDQFMKDVQGWLSPADPWKNYQVARESRHRGTSEWFIQGPTFSEWKSGSGSLLWVCGKPGAGKGIFCSAIIQDIEVLQKAGRASLAFFYFDSMEVGKKDQRGLLSSLLVQLCHQSDSYRDILSRLYTTHSNGAQHPNSGALVGCLKELLSVQEQTPVFLILDGLDECSNTGSPSPREEVLRLLKELIDLQFLHICVTSRLETDIQSVLTPLVSHYISLQDESGHKDDINDYIKDSLHHDPMMKRWSDDKESIIEALSKLADGRFGWACSKLVYIRQFSGSIQDLLANLSVTPNEMYHNTLKEIEGADQQLAHYVFRCVAVVFRPLHVEELVEFFAFDLTAGTIPVFDEGRRRNEDVVLPICSKLLSIVKVNDSSVVKFSHRSVQDYLTSSHISDSSGTTSLPYDFITPAHTRAAQACLGILLYLNDSITRNSLLEFPLAEYAAEHWVDHVRSNKDVPQSVEEQLGHLFDPSKRHFKIWIWIHDPMAPSWSRTERTEKPPPQPRETFLRYAAFYGLPSIVRYLIEGHPKDVPRSDLDDGLTPLHVASSQGHVEVARVLLNHGADVTAQDKYGWTSLHKASEGGHAEVVSLLLEYRLDAMAQDNRGLMTSAGNVAVAPVPIKNRANATTKIGSTPLHQACRRSGQVQLEVARILLHHGADVTAQDEYGWTPLHEASSGGHTDLVIALLGRGANVGVQDRYGWTPYHSASFGKHHKLVSILRKFGADAKSKDKSLSLHEASFEGHVGFARMLLQRGENAKAQDKYGTTPLHKASEGGHAEVVFLLLEYGADATAQDNLGLTPLHQASKGGHVEVAQILFKNGVDATAQDKLSWTSLHHSCVRGHKEVARILLDHGVPVTVQDKLGWTPLHGASFGGHTEVCELLLRVEYGAKTTVQDEQGRTPLHLASGNGHAEIARILLRNDKEIINLQDKLGWTSLHKALSVGDVEVARVLLDHNADKEARDNDGRNPLDYAPPTVYKQLFSDQIDSSQSGHCCCTIL